MANWADVSDVALLKRLRNSEEWLRALCIDLFRKNGLCQLDKGINAPIRIVVMLDARITATMASTTALGLLLIDINSPLAMLSPDKLTNRGTTAATVADGAGCCAFRNNGKARMVNNANTENRIVFMVHFSCLSLFPELLHEVDASCCGFALSSA
jgi:hypothetical protein